MSDTINTNLLERASEVMTYFEGTQVDYAVERAIELNDLDRVRYLVVSAEAEMSREEYYASDSY